MYILEYIVSLWSKIISRSPSMLCKAVTYLFLYHLLMLCPWSKDRFAVTHWRILWIIPNELIVMPWRAVFIKITRVCLEFIPSLGSLLPPGDSCKDMSSHSYWCTPRIPHSHFNDDCHHHSWQQVWQDEKIILVLSNCCIS